MDIQDIFNVVFFAFLQFLDFLFYHFRFMPFLFQIYPPYFSTAIKSLGLGLCKVSVSTPCQDRKGPQSVDALQEPIEEPTSSIDNKTATTQRHDGQWHRSIF